jgi:hypothetical protein
MASRAVIPVLNSLATSYEMAVSHADFEWCNVFAHLVSAVGGALCAEIAAGALSDQPDTFLALLNLAIEV